MKLIVAGFDDKAIAARFESAALAYGLHAATVSGPETAELLSSSETDWEILALGPEASGGDLPKVVERLVEDHPMGVVIVVDGSGGDKGRRDCLRAGALELLPAQADRPAIDLAIARAVGVVRRAEKRISAEKSHVIAQLAVGVNHEINNPLTGLMGTAELILLENSDLPEKIRNDLETIISQARRIHSVTTRLRNLDHLKTVPYDDHETMIDLSPEEEETPGQVMATDEAGAVFETPSLLVVDDNQLILDLIERLLADRFVVECASNSSDALSKLQYKDFDLAVVDMVMPDMDGLDLFRAIRRMKPNQRVLLSAVDGKDERIGQAIDEGALGAIQKPFEFQELEQTLRAAVRAAVRV